MTKGDPDQPPNAGPLARLQLVLGRVAVRASNLLRPRLSLGVRLVALDGSGRRVMLVRHSYVPGLSLPGGGVEVGETCRQAVEREAREEAGLFLTEAPQLFHVYLNERLGRRDHVVLFVARGATAGPRSAGGEIVEAAFHPVDGLPADTTPATLARLAEVLGEVSPSDIW